MHRFIMPFVVIALAAISFGQPIVPTGNVMLDFPATNVFADPGGQDVTMPPTIPGISGWDIAAIAIAYDEAADTLYVGIDTYGIAGDADGDGAPSGTSPALAALGGSDNANFAGGECFTIALDIDGDGVCEVIGGTPLGQDLSGYTFAVLEGDLTVPEMEFGVSLPQNVGQVWTVGNSFGTDIEVSIPNFSSLTFAHARPFQTHIGVHVALGSWDDATIGFDRVSAPNDPKAPLALPIIILPCIPIDNFLEVVGYEFRPNETEMTYRYGLRDNYGCCILASFQQNQSGTTLPILGQPVILVGAPGLGNMVAVDLGIPPSSGQMVDCKDNSFVVPNGILPIGTRVFLQVFSYPASFGPPYLASNVICYEQFQ